MLSNILCSYVVKRECWLTSRTLTIRIDLAWFTENGTDCSVQNKKEECITGHSAVYLRAPSLTTGGQERIEFLRPTHQPGR